MSLCARLWLCANLLAPAGFATAQDPGPVYDAPYVPSPLSTVDEMLRLAEVGPGDVVYDLGAGDGRVVIAAAVKFGARGVGVEIDGELELEFAQRHQDVTASAVLDGAPAHVWEASLQGDRLSFVLVEHHGTEREAGLYFEGRVAGRVIEGTLTRGVGATRQVRPWRAER